MNVLCTFTLRSVYTGKSHDLTETLRLIDIIIFFPNSKGPSHNFVAPVFKNIYRWLLLKMAKMLINDLTRLNATHKEIK